MGYCKTISRAEHIRQNRDYIIAEYTGREGKGRTAASLAEEFNVSKRYLTTFLSQWREEGLLEPLHRAPLDPDKHTILSLLQAGMSRREIATKWGCSRSHLSNTLKRWGFTGKDPRNGSPVPHLSLNTLNSEWAGITEKTVVTVGRIPRFYLVPITAETAEID